MSLINQMLKDLEKRSRPLTVPEYIVSSTRSSSPSIVRRNKLILFIISALAFILSLTYLLTHWTSDQEILTSLETNQTLMPVNELSRAANPEHKMNTLTGITLEVQNDLTDLRLLLNQEALYTVTQDEKQKLVVVLEQTQLVANIPSFVNSMDSALEGLEMTNLEDGNLQMSFTLKEGAVLSHLNLQTSNKLPELQLIFQYHPTFSGGEYMASSPEPIILQKKEGSIKKLSYDVNLDEAYQYALQLSNENRFDEAIASLKHILSQDPGFSPARETVATLLIKKDDIAQAQEILAKGLALQPNYAPFVKLKAETLVQQNKINDALKLLLFSPPEISEDAEYYAFIAALYQQNEQHLPAKEIYERLLTLKPNNSTWWIGLGISLESIGERGQAADAFQMASHDINLQPDMKEYVEARLNALQ